VMAAVPAFAGFHHALNHRFRIGFPSTPVRFVPLSGRPSSLQAIPFDVRMNVFF
jgi:hypothetical protein